jgi:riboflavin synthase
MFTGIIEELGTITKLDSDSKRDEHVVAITISAPKTASKLALGDSVAIDGACFTAVVITPEEFTVEAILETQQRTIIKGYKIGTTVNLESTLTLQKGISGHLVQGHVDGIGTVKSISTTSTRSRSPFHPKSVASSPSRDRSW